MQGIRIGSIGSITKAIFGLVTGTGMLFESYL